MSAKKAPEPGIPTTLYRLVGVGDLSEAVRERYRTDPQFTSTESSLGGWPSYTITGAMGGGRTKWCDRVQTLVQEDCDVVGRTPAGAIIVRIPEGDDDGSESESPEGIAYALTFGMGFQLIDWSRIDEFFGQRVAIRAADPRALMSVTSTTLDDRGRTSRASVPAGDSLQALGAGDIGEAISRVVAKGAILGLSRPPAKTLRMRGADALSIPLGLTASEVQNDLLVLEQLLGQEPIPGLQSLESLSKVKNIDERSALDQLLGGVLAEEETEARIALTWLHEVVDDNALPTSWKLGGLGREHHAIRHGLPEWGEIASVLAHFPADERLKRLSKATVAVYGDENGEHLVSQTRPLRQWLAFEVQHDKKTFALFRGDWYRVKHDYAEQLDRRIGDLLSLKWDREALPWVNQDEADYNEKLGAHLGGAVLDAKLAHTSAHPRGFELCDVWLPDGTFIHSKKGDASAPFSHLVSQALISTDAMLHDEEALRVLSERLAQSGAQVPEKVRPKRVVLVMARKSGKPFTAKNLFTFTKVNLVRLEDHLRAASVDLFVVFVPEESNP